MKQIKMIGWLICLHLSTQMFAQNPIWTLPEYQYKPGVSYIPLPQTPNIPGTSTPVTDDTEAYQGAPAEHVHSAYSDPSGNLLFFTVDEKVYDNDGWVVGDLRTGFTKRGWNERLILPMGTDCERYAIIYPASAETNELYGGTSDRMRIYMAVYDLNGTNAYSEYAQGDLEGQTGQGSGSSLIDITNRDCQEQSPTYPGIYGCGGSGNPVPQANYRGNYQIAATGLIDNCFYYVYIFDGSQIMRYKLDSTGLLWDDYVQVIPQSGSNGFNQRTEMELIQLSNGDYRIAIPTYDSDGTFISIYDINDSNYELDLSSHQQIDLSEDSNFMPAEMIGLEFDQSGRYLYFTHENNNTPQWQNTILECYDFNTASIVTSSLPTLTNIGDYQYSFIERYGNTLYLVSDDDVATLENSNIPGSAVWTSNFQSISAGYKNKGGESFAGFERSILPDQIDMDYPNLASFSCDCCSKWNPAVNGYKATMSDTWSPGGANNPFGSASGEVYINGTLEIEPGVDITIDGMKFYFSRDSKVVVKREENNETGAYLYLTNGTVFTADFRCPALNIDNCGDSENCDKERWQGIRVEGDGTIDTQVFNSSTPHGRLKVDKNSMIEYAMIGAQAGHDQISSSGGGIIQMTDSRVKDCIIGVQFDPFVKRSSSSTELYTASFINTTQFTTTSDWFGANNPRTFVEVNGSSGLILRGNVYENEVPSLFADNERGVGVTMYDSRVKSDFKCTGTSNPCPTADVVRSLYKELTYGVYGLNSSKYSRAYYEYFSIFENNDIGISINNFTNPFILDGNFEVMATPGSTGLYMTNSTGYTVEGNHFSTYDGVTANRNIGIHVDNSGSDNNEIYRNFFQNVSKGGYATEINSETGTHFKDGLDWLCNEFTSPILQADIYLDGTMSDEQGSCNTIPAGNLFSSNTQYNLFSTFSSMRDINGDKAEIDYNHHSGLPSNLVPSSVSQSDPPAADFLLQPCFTSYGKSSCPVKKTSIPDGYVFPKSSAYAELTFEMVDANVSELVAQIEELEATIDGGATEFILGSISDMESTESEDSSNIEEVVALIENVDGPISADVIEALMNSGIVAFENLAASYLEADYVVSEEESLLESAEFQLDEFWKEVVSYYMSDTVGTISHDEMVELLQIHQPGTVQKFASIVCPADEQGWIKPINCTYANEVNAIGLPEAVNGNLPRYIPEYFENGFFHMPGNTNLLNQHYIDHHAIYDAVVPESELEDVIIDESKSNSSTGDNGVVNSSAQLLVNPNPFKEQVVFDLSQMNLGERTATIEIYDMVGRKVFDTRVAKDQVQLIIDAQNLPVGFMIYKLVVDGTPVKSGKVLRVE